MSHFVQAFIGEPTLLEKIQMDFGASTVTSLAQGLALLPLDEKFYDAIPETEEPGAIQDGFQFLSTKVLGLIIQYSKQSFLGYFETEYFGGAGDQGAVLTKNGIVVWGPKTGDGSINAILQSMGIQKNGEFDEFAAVGLQRYRNNEDWISAGKRTIPNRDH